MLAATLLVLPGSPAAEAAAPSAADVSPESRAKLHAAFERLYQLEFRPATELFRQVMQAEPASASARAFLASALLYETLALQGTLQSQLFVTSDEFLREPRRPPDPELRHAFQQAVAESQRVARERLAKNPDDADGLFALGLTYGAQADYAAGVEARYFQGLHLGERAYEYTQKLRRLRPEIADAGVVLGVREFVLGSLPRIQRFLLFFVGASGDRDRGLRHLEEAAARGEFLRPYARVLLAVALVREGQLEGAGRVLESLRSDYPRNPLILIELARLYRQQRDHARAAKLCQELLAELTTRPSNPRVLGPENALLELGRTQAAAGELDAALDSFRRVMLMASVEKRVLAWALLERGRIFDQRGERDKALSEYEKVSLLEADAEATRLAGRYRREPYFPEPRR